MAVSLGKSQGVASRGGPRSEGAPNLLFVGGVFPHDEENAILSRSRGPIQFAANALQWNLIEGFYEVTQSPVSLLNAVFVGAYPRQYREIWVGGRRWSHAPGASDVSVGFLNLFGLKHLWRAAAVTLKACQWAAAGSSSGPKRMVLYSVHAPFMVAAAIAKLFDESLEDLPMIGYRTCLST